MVPIGMAFAAPPKRQAAIKLAAKTILRIGSSRVHTLTDCGAVLEPLLKSAFICASAYVDLIDGGRCGRLLKSRRAFLHQSCGEPVRTWTNLVSIWSEPASAIT
jgi:hypothetical protein